MRESELEQIEREFETLADGHPEYSHKLVIGDEFGQEWIFWKRPGEPMQKGASVIEGVDEECP